MVLARTAANGSFDLQVISMEIADHNVDPIAALHNATLIGKSHRVGLARWPMFSMDGMTKEHTWSGCHPLRAFSRLLRMR